MAEIDADLREWINDQNEEALLADGFEEAILGMAERCSKHPLVVYDAEKCLSILVERGMSYQDALEYFNFNTLGSWVGENTPLFLWRHPEMQADPVAMALNALEDKIDKISAKIDQTHAHFDRRLDDLEERLRRDR